MRRRSGAAHDGFSVIELLVAMAVTMLVTSAVFAMLDPATGAFEVQPESADVRQRLRAASDVLLRELMSAGAGPSTVLPAQFPPVAVPAVFPMRVGRRSPDGPGTFDSTRVSFWSVSPAAPQAKLAAPLASASGTATIASGPGCPEGDSSCGFQVGMLVAVFGSAGAWDLFSITGVQGSTLAVQHNFRDAANAFAAGDVIAEATVRTYLFKDAPAGGVPQIVRYDAAGGADVPVVDHVASVQFEYMGDPDPPRAVQTPPGEPLRVTYGPTPPAPAFSVSGFRTGENCVFVRSESGVVLPGLPVLAPGSALVALPPSMLTDGPWCPDATNPNRYDADLLRVRQVVISIRIESAVASLRGPAGPLFTRGGTARGGRFVPDRFSRMVVTPRALNVGQ